MSSIGIRLSKDSHDVVTYSKYHNPQKNNHTSDLSIFEDFFAGFAASYYFDEQEKYMSAIESGDREDIHEGEDKRKQACNVPKFCPDPLRAIDLGYANRPLKAVAGFFLTADDFPRPLILAESISIASL